MPRRQSGSIESYGDNALTWCIGGLLLIEFIAALLSQVDFGLALLGVFRARRVPAGHNSAIAAAKD